VTHPQRWKKLGLVYQPGGDRPWRLSHAATPVAEVLRGSMIRVYFTSRDANNRSHISCLELDLRRPAIVRGLRDEPLVEPGPAGAFDADGSAMGCLVRDGSRRLLYYLGWQLQSDVPWRNSIGLCIATDDSMTFTKRPGQLLGFSAIDPHSISYPWVLRDGDRWRMWYGSNLGWGKTEETMRHVIKYAESPDGLNWERDGRIAIPLDDASGEFAVARPCVLRDDDGYHMWYSRRTPAYRIGYAHSPDGLVWTRRDSDAGPVPTPGDWDGQSVEYGCVFDADGDRWMLYNGDAYGRAGFGLAMLSP
jgi:hypothetical protein